MENPKPLLWGLAAVVLVAVAVAGILFISQRSEIGGEPVDDQAVLDALPVDFSPATVWRVQRRRSPSIMKLTIELTNATQTYVVYPEYPFAGDTPPVEQPFILDGGTATDIGRLEPISIQPDSCDPSCTVVLRLGDAHDVHIFSDGEMVVTEREAERVPTQHVVGAELDEPIEPLEDATIKVCVSGIDVDDGGGLGRSITLQRRRSDQVGISQVSLEQSAPWPLHRPGSRGNCQAEFSLAVEHWGGDKAGQMFEAVVLNVVHWGESAVAMDSVEVEVTVQR